MRHSVNQNSSSKPFYFSNVNLKYLLRFLDKRNVATKYYTEVSIFNEHIKLPKLFTVEETLFFSPSVCSKDIFLLSSWVDRHMQWQSCVMIWTRRTRQCLWLAVSVDFGQSALVSNEDIDMIYLTGISKREPSVSRALFMNINLTLKLFWLF